MFWLPSNWFLTGRGGGTVSFPNFKQNSPEIPGRFAARNINFWELCVHWSYTDFYFLPSLIPEYLEGHTHGYLAHVGHVLAPTACDLHAAEKPKVDAFPDPGSGMNRHIQVGGDEDGVVLHQPDLQGVPEQLQAMSSSWNWWNGIVYLIKNPFGDSELKYYYLLSK